MSIEAGFAGIGLAAMWVSVRRLRPARDRIWVDDGYLLWIRWYPGTDPTEPIGVALADIAEVRLSDGDQAVIVETRDGAGHSVTDLGTVSQRIRLLRAIGDLTGPDATRVPPERSTSSG